MRAKKALEAVGVYDTGVRVYSSLNPPPGGGGTVPLVQAADQAVTATAASSITDLAEPITEAGHYHFVVCLVVTSAATTTGIRPSMLTTGVAPTRIAYSTFSPASATTTTLSHNTAGAATAALAAPVIVKVEGMAYWATAPGTATNLRAAIASEVSGSAVTVHAGSHMTVEKVA